ncbi:hypothetical protein FisN_13Hh222 [Fistulifera solaris]|uniref:DUF6824 domain-containing protein n=1 Tax=Fistulifera solaris TaxID=1519565 RepID=A0A1Z5KMW9_FISSO|nr:hypothetical protein FisN_13Hh222 [Fistulifera solaris]|eukprot:GAX27683.1 hypothetical protein FisN_13Hh222 [Fistulifera solaris]
MPSESKVEAPCPVEKPVRVPSKDEGGDQSEMKIDKTPSRSSASEESVEVVLGESGNAAVVAETPQRPRHHQDQSIFRYPQPVRPRAMRTPHGHSYHPQYPYMHGSGSWGYHHPGDYPTPPSPRYPMAGSNPSASFEDQYHHTPYYSPHVRYPPPAYPSEDVNVVSPNHRGEYRPPTTPRPRHGSSSQPRYQYPPTSPVSRPGKPTSAPRMRNYAMRRGDSSYSRRSTPVVAASFDSEAHNRSVDPYHHQYYGGASWGSFDSAAHPQFDDHRYYGMPPPEAAYSSYAYSPPPAYPSESFPPPEPYMHMPPSFGYSFDDEEHHQEYDHRPGYQHPKHMAPKSSRKAPVARSTADRQAVLPKAAVEVDFDVADPPMEPITPPSDNAVCDSMAEVNSFDVILGRGGGTNSQVGNRRFRQLVQDFQPIYLLAKRKEKPLLARTIVLIIRKRGGRFLKKNEETGELFEVGDTKAEAKTSQALREGLDVRATRSAANEANKKKKKKTPSSPGSSNSDESPTNSPKVRKAPESPPVLPELQGEKEEPGSPHSQDSFRKRRRTRSNDQFFPDFCPPRADLGRTSPSLADADDDDDDDDDDGVLEMPATPQGKSSNFRDVHYETCNDSIPSQGCAGIAMDLVTGAATGSFCLAPAGWRG